MIYKILAYKSQVYLLLIFMFFLYLITPLLIYIQFDADPYMLLLSKMALISIVGVLCGFWLLPRFIHIHSCPIISMSGKKFTLIIFLIFFLFITIVIATAENIPLLLALKNRDPDELGAARALFLKARTGYQSVFVYINAVLTTSFIPYAILLSFIRGYAFKWFFLATPYFYSFIFLEKVFFLKFILPFISYLASFKDKKYYKRYLCVSLISIPLVIYINTVISGFGSQKIAINKPINQTACAQYYTAKYVSCANKSHLGFIAWRIIAVPVFTAADSLKLFRLKYNNQLLLGRTSTALSFITHQQNVKFEREVFNSEWGGDSTRTASANSAYFIEQYVNFGWLGLILSSILIGFIYSVLNKSSDVALSSLAIVLSFNLALGGFIACMLSGGFLLLFTFLFFVRLEE